MKYDLIIISSGSVGATARHYTTRVGLNVLMTDAHMPPHQHDSHRGDTRLIRHAHGENGKYVPLVLRVRMLWDELSRHNEDDPTSVRSGIINLSLADPTFLANVTHSIERWQLNVEKLDTQRIMAHWPEICVPDNYIGLFETDSGFLRSKLAVKTWIQLVKGTDYAQLFNCPVTIIRYDDGGVAIETADDECQVKKATVYAGIWVKDLLLELSVRSTHKASAWYQADGRCSVKDKFPTFIGELPDGGQYYDFPAENDILKIGKHNGGQVIHSVGERVSFAEVVSDGSETFPFLRNVLPSIGCCPYGAVCTYNNSPSEDFIIDTLPGHDNTLLTISLSGHGFKFASVLGEMTADFTQGKKSDFDLTPFRLFRFQ